MRWIPAQGLAGLPAGSCLWGALGLLALIPFAGRAYSHGKYALPDLVENLYGKGPRLVASVVIPVAWTGIVAAQIIAAAKLLMTFTPMGYTTAAIVAAAVFTGYTLAGGQLSILRTDFFQAWVVAEGATHAQIMLITTMLAASAHVAFSMKSVVLRTPATWL